MTKSVGPEDRPLIVEGKEGETEAETMASVMTEPFLRHGVVTSALSNSMINGLPGDPRFDDFAKTLKIATAETGKGQIGIVSELLTAQALTLDAMMTELLRRSVMNFGDYPLAAERYARLGFKAQANSRATLEALAKLHQPREQTVRHVHVNEGGQAVIADEFHHHTGGEKNGQTIEQPHAPKGSAAGQCPTLPCPDPIGEAVPIASDQGAEPVQNARRQGKRRAEGQ